MSIGTFTNVYQNRSDSENYNAGTYNGTCITAGKVDAPVTGYTPGTPLAISGFPVFTIGANFQGYYFSVDQGTAAYPVQLIITSSTSKTVTFNLVAGQAAMWDIGQVAPSQSGGGATAVAIYGAFSGSVISGTLTAFGNIASATLNVPAGLAYTGTVNLVGRLYTL